MKKVWVLNAILSLLIVAAGVYAWSWVKNTLPKQLAAPSSLYIQAEETKKEEVNPQLKEIIYEAQKLVVKIEIADGSFGSGFLYNNQGDIITNAHVVANAKEVKVITVDSKELTGEVIGISVDTDIAVVRVPELEGTKPLRIANNQKAELGDEVIALGSPLGLQNTVTTGIVSGVGRSFHIEPFRYEDMYQISAPIAPGNSGGPLIDTRTGEVIGINSAVMEQGVIGFSIPINNVISLIRSWSETPMTSLPRVGVAVPGNNNGQSSSNEDIANYIAQYYFESINHRDYVTAYSLLGSELQSTLSYEEFRADFMNVLAVEINSTFTEMVDRNVNVTVLIQTQQRGDDGLTFTNYECNFVLGLENDQMKILSKDREKID
ncbi:S1C family serine protease [Sutcliffiella sp. NC1]|uniref:S1C family serine protease n=1 Tax=Sutcliffiella sp. NC1 TaxID=3004096 RepID=UPI0022DDA51B|nr:trypsin-like peptidase domain-containing protein [Sutcliffiella sp. NC1]WBL15588.1 trypsin-like peptidase domain-containing protein [Sutcliffiella sp. NC1]